MPPTLRKMTARRVGGCGNHGAQTSARDHRPRAGVDRLGDGVEDAGGADGVVYGRPVDPAVADLAEEARRLDHLEVVVAHRHPGPGLSVDALSTVVVPLAGAIQPGVSGPGSIALLALPRSRGSFTTRRP